MVFSPSHAHHATDRSGSNNVSDVKSLQDDDLELALEIYTPKERREYLFQRGSDTLSPSSGTLSSEAQNLTSDMLKSETQSPTTDSMRSDPARLHSGFRQINSATRRKVCSISRNVRRKLVE